MYMYALFAAKEHVHVYVHVLMRDEKEGRKKQERQSNTAHPMYRVYHFVYTCLNER